MRKAKIGTPAALFAFAAVLAGFAIASCGGKIDEVSSGGDDAATGDSPDVLNGLAMGDATTFDAGSITPFSPDGAPPYPPVDHGPQDTEPACSSRTPAACSCTGEDCPDPPDWYFGQLVQGCLESGGYVCGWVYADFDSDGCAMDLRALDPNDTFVECITKQLDSERWTCMSGGGNLSTYVDCTTK